MPNRSAHATRTRTRTRTRRPGAGAVGLAALVVALAVVLPAAAVSAQGPDPSTSTSPSDPSGSGSTTTTTVPDPGCDQVVHDPEGVLADQPAVGQAAFDLVAGGATLRLRVVDRLPDADDVADLETDCLAWLSGGSRPDRALLLFVAPDARGAALWYGSAYRDRIGARFASLRRDVLDGPTELGVDGVAELLTGIQDLVVAEPASDPFGCDALVWDPEGRLGDVAEVEAEAFALQVEGDVHVRVEPQTDGDLDSRQEQLEEACPRWTRDGLDLPTDLLVVTVQPSERQTGTWYGTRWDRAMEGRWEDIQADDMNPRFQRSDWSGGLAAGLRAIGRPVTTPYDFGSGFDDDDDGYDDGRAGSGDGGDTGELWFWGIVALGGIGAAWAFSYASWKSKYDRGETDLTFGEYSAQNSRRGGGYRSFGRSGGSWGGGGGGRRSSGGGGGRRSSGGGGRRSGGGSSRW